MFTKMKTAQLAVFLLSSAFISCSQQEDIFSDNALDGTEITTTVTVKAPEVFGSRAVPAIYDYGTESGKIYAYSGTSGMPSIGNVDLGEHPLSYTVGIYIPKVVEGSDPTTYTYTLVDRQEQTGVKASEAYFNFRLIKGQTYHIVAYADFSATGKTDLTDITVNPTQALNDELADAFFVSQDFVADEFLGAVLKRPFAKLRLVTHDLDRFAAGRQLEITNIEVKYNNQPMLHVTKFNALSGDFNYDENDEKTHTVQAKPVSYAKEYTEKDSIIEDGAAVFTMYLPANLGTPLETPDYGTPVNEEVLIPQSWMYPFDVTISYVNKDHKNKPCSITRSYGLDIPVKRNWLTTVDVKNFWSDNTGVTVSVNPEFEGNIQWEPNTHLVKTEKELKSAVTAIENSTEKEGKIVLDADIELTGKFGIEIGTYYTSTYNNFRLSTEDPITLHLDLNGHTLSGTYDGVFYSGAIIALYGPHTLIIDDSSESCSGVIKALEGPVSEKIPNVITSWRYGSTIIINGGKLLSQYGQEVIYLNDPLPHMGGYLYGEDYRDANGKAYLNGKPSTLTINGGWFESVDAVYAEEVKRVVINLYNGGSGSWPDYPKTTEGSPNAMGYGNVHINGGSFVEFNPAKGDNISGLYTVDPATHQHVKREWVDPNKYTVLTSTVNGRTVYTVVHKDYDGQTPETWKE